jgi:hypothetical protein
LSTPTGGEQKCWGRCFGKRIWLAGATVLVIALAVTVFVVAYSRGGGGSNGYGY